MLGELKDPHDALPPELSPNQQSWCDDLDKGTDLLDAFLKWLDNTNVLEASTVVDEAKLARWSDALHNLPIPSDKEFIE